MPNDALFSFESSIDDP